MAYIHYIFSYFLYFNKFISIGLFCFSVSEKMLCCPDQQDIGSIHIVNLENNHHSTVKAHNAPLSCMETDYEGDLIATTSTKVIGFTKILSDSH